MSNQNVPKEEFEQIDGVKVPKPVKVNKESPTRSIIKAISWRVIASGTTFILAIIFFGNDPQAVEKATGVAVAESFIKMALYYLHERAWINITWGKIWTKNKLIRQIKLNYIRWKRKRRKAV
jgi:uncharacterized membrane protein